MEGKLSKGIDIEVSRLDEMPIVYANYCEVSAAPEEFHFTFAIRTSDPSEAKGLIRVIITLPHAVRLSEAIQISLRKREMIFGPIQQPEPVLTPEQLREFGIEVEIADGNNDDDM